MEIIKVEPGARRLLEGYQGLEYNFETAVADLIDNSISARCKNVNVELRLKGKTNPSVVVISDDGCGMEKRTLIEAMRYGSKKDYSASDLGKFGLGLKTASLSQTKLLTVITKKSQSASIFIARWDIEFVKEKDEWGLKVLDFNELELWEKELVQLYLKKRGTLVIWKNPEGFQHLKEDSGFDEVHDKLESHLSMVFSHFLKKKKNIFINGSKVAAWDPFCLKEKTKKLKTFSFSCFDAKQKKHKIIVTPYILPTESEFSSREAWDDASGPKKWNRQQGLYFFRSKRLLQAGGWSNCKGNLEEHQKLLRVRVDFPSKLDNQFGLNITKMRAIIPYEIKETFEKHLSKWRREAEKRYRKQHGKVSDKATKKIINFKKGKIFNLYERNGKVFVENPDFRLPKKIKRLLSKGKVHQLGVILYLFLENLNCIKSSIKNPKNIQTKLFV
jgi:hypothetical protein